MDLMTPLAKSAIYIYIHTHTVQLKPALNGLRDGPFYIQCDVLAHLNFVKSGSCKDWARPVAIEKCISIWSSSNITYWWLGAYKLRQNTNQTLHQTTPKLQVRRLQTSNYATITSQTLTDIKLRPKLQVRRLQTSNYATITSQTLTDIKLRHNYKSDAYRHQATQKWQVRRLQTSNYVKITSQTLTDIKLRQNYKSDADRHQTTPKWQVTRLQTQNYAKIQVRRLQTSNYAKIQVRRLQTSNYAKITSQTLTDIKLRQNDK